MRISDWSSDVCSSDLVGRFDRDEIGIGFARRRLGEQGFAGAGRAIEQEALRRPDAQPAKRFGMLERQFDALDHLVARRVEAADVAPARLRRLDHHFAHGRRLDALQRSEEHTSELQSLMRISYAVFCLKKKKKK